jgi:hypothetical protein
MRAGWTVYKEESRCAKKQTVGSPRAVSQATPASRIQQTKLDGK